MGILNKKVLGAPTGAVGDVQFSYRNGQTIIGTRPASFMPGTDTMSVNRRNRFGITAKFAKSVNSIDALKNLWDAKTENTISPFNGIFRASYPYVSPTDVTSSATIVPQLFGFNITTTDVSIDGSAVNVSIDPIGNNAGIDPLVEKYIKLCVVIKCTDGTKETLPKLMFVPLDSANVMLNLVNPLTFSITLADQEKEIYSLYDTHLSYLALVTLKEDGTAVNYSSGFTA